MVAALTGIVGGQQGTEPILALRHGLAPSPVLSLPAEENKLFGQLEFGKPGKTDSNNYLPDRKRTSASLQAEVSETLLHGHNAGMLCQPLSLTPRTHDTPRTDRTLQELRCHGASARALQLP